MTGPLAFIDTETTGLNLDLHQAYEVAWAIDDGPIRALPLPHTLENADMLALNVGGYFDRGFAPFENTPPQAVLHELMGATLVGSNPAFDAGFLRKTFGVAVWHYRLIDVAQGAMWVFGYGRPKGLADVAAHLRELGHDIPEPDHTAAGDVATTRAAYIALRQEST